MHDGAGGHRGLPAAGGTFIGEWFGLQTPGAAAAASGADKPVRPAALEEVFCARRLRRKTTLELDQRFWKSALRSRHEPHLLKPPEPIGSLRPCSLFVHNILVDRTFVHKPPCGI